MRSLYGKICCILGVILNVILFAGKLFLGLLSASLAITADAFNNLSDACSSIITLAGFRLAEKKPDAEHPFGHGRIEYISGLIVSMLIILMGTELAKSSISKLFAPQLPVFSSATVIILSAAVLVKIYIFLYNRKYGKLISSSAMLATAADSLCDALSTAAVLAVSIIAHFTSFIYLDSICGLALSILILVTGVRSALETVSPLLGKNPEPQFVQKIYDIAMSEKKVFGVHDIIVHDYGPGRIIVSLHCEVSGKEDAILLHEIIDGLEIKISQELGCETVIHTDPLEENCDLTEQIRNAISEALSRIHKNATFHDLRIIRGSSKINVIFDLVLPFDCGISHAQAKSIISDRVNMLDGNYECIIKFDADYTGNLSKD